MGGERLHNHDIEALQAAVERGDREVVDLLRCALEAACGAVQAPGLEMARSAVAERRLGDRILAALLLALDQNDLDASEHLVLALEAAMTRFGGPAVVESRNLPEGVEEAYIRLDGLRRRVRQLGPEGDR